MSLSCFLSIWGLKKSVVLSRDLHETSSGESKSQKSVISYSNNRSWGLNVTETIVHVTRETAREQHINQSNSVGVNFNTTYVYVQRCTCSASPVRHTFSQRHTFRANYLPQSLHLDNVKRNVTTGCKNDLLKPFKGSSNGCERLSETGSSSLLSGSRWLTSKPCFSDGTHTSLFAAQSAWLAAENDELDVGEPGPTPEYRKRVTSLAPPPVALDMVLLGDTNRH